MWKKILFFNAFFLVPVPFILSCSTRWYREDADKEAYTIIREKQQAVLGRAEPFSVQEGEEETELGDKARKGYTEAGEGLDVNESSGERTKEEEGLEEGELEEEAPPSALQETEPVSIDLNEALQLSFHNNRDYQSQKESVYLEALDLTYQRYLWRPRFGGILSGDLTRNSSDERSGSASADFSVGQILATGGELGLNFATDLLRFYTGGPSKEAYSLISLSFLQPLWRDSGSLIARENLTQAERNVAYEIRSFARYRKSFAVDIASSYYSVLQQKDRLENQEGSYERLKLNRERSELMGKAGRLAEYQVDQARQDELDARNAVVVAKQSYDQRLDGFKISLGLPMETFLELDSNDLKKLGEEGLKDVAIDLEEAIQAALKMRLDLRTQKDQVEDSKRRVLIAENGLGPDLDFDFSYSVGTERPTRFMKFRFNRAAYSGGLSLNLPLERKSERNAYRQSLISLERSKRSLSLLEDTIKQSVRQSYRNLNQAKETYEIQKLSLDLAKKRVESTTLLQQAGRAETRDLLEANAALLQAQNALTSAIVSHTIALLDFLVDIELLEVSEEGQIASIETLDKGWIQYEGRDDSSEPQEEE